jgi:uncharacterized membrane protein
MAIVLGVHIAAGAVALVTGPWQFPAAVRSRRPLHRVLGRVYLLAGVLPAALTAVPVALRSRHPLTRAVLWLITAGLAYRAARRRDIAAHRAWMIRNYALTLLFLTARALVPILLLATGKDPADLIPIGQVAGWMLNLAVAEALIRRRRTRAARPVRRRRRRPRARSLRSPSRPGR